MNQLDKVEVVDFIINILKEHEQTLDNLVERVEDALSTRSSINGSTEILIPPNQPTKISLNQWADFKKKCQHADYACYTFTDSIFQVTAKKNVNLYEYVEKVPDLTVEICPNADDVTISGLTKDNLSKNYGLLYGRLNSGLELNTKEVSISDTSEKNLKKLVFNIDEENTKKWLSKELEISLDNIFFGEIKF